MYVCDLEGVVAGMWGVLPAVQRRGEWLRVRRYERNIDGREIVRLVHKL